MEEEETRLQKIEYGKVCHAVKVFPRIACINMTRTMALSMDILMERENTYQIPLIDIDLQVTRINLEKNLPLIEMKLLKDFQFRVVSLKIIYITAITTESTLYL